MRSKKLFFNYYLSALSKNKLIKGYKWAFRKLFLFI